MPKRHRSHSTEFKRQVVAEYHAGETLHALGRRHDLSRNLIRIWVEKAEAGALNDDEAAAELLADVRAFCEISAARDWPALARLLPEDFTLVSRRRLVGTEVPMGRAEYLATRGAVDDLGVDDVVVVRIVA